MNTPDLMGALARPPARSLDQRLAALEKANHIRTRRAELKRELKAQAIVPQQLLGDPDCETMKLFTVLLATPKIGRVKANQILRTIEASPSKTLAGLSKRQVGALDRVLRDRSIA